MIEAVSYTFDFFFDRRVGLFLFIEQLAAGVFDEYACGEVGAPFGVVRRGALGVDIQDPRGVVGLKDELFLDARGDGVQLVLRIEAAKRSAGGDVFLDEGARHFFRERAVAELTADEGGRQPGRVGSGDIGQPGAFVE